MSTSLCSYIMLRKLKILCKRSVRWSCYSACVLLCCFVLFRYTHHSVDIDLLQPKYDTIQDVHRKSTDLNLNKDNLHTGHAKVDIEKEVDNVAARDENSMKSAEIETEKSQMSSITDNQSTKTYHSTPENVEEHESVPISHHTNPKVDDAKSTASTHRPQNGDVAKTLIGRVSEGTGGSSIKRGQTSSNNPAHGRDASKATVMQTPPSIQQIIREASTQANKKESSPWTPVNPYSPQADYNSVNETEEEFMKRMEERMEKRRRKVEEACQRLKVNPENKTHQLWEATLPNPKPWIFVSEKYPLLYCEIPKSGCSNWKKVIMVLNDLANSTDSLKQGQVHSTKVGMMTYFPPKEQKEIYINSTKLIVVREPFERLVSAYLDKVADKPSHVSVFPRFSSEVAKKYGKRWTDPTKILQYGMREITVCDETYEAVLTCEKPYHVIKIVSAVFGRKDNVTCTANKDLSQWDGKQCVAAESQFITSQVCDGKKTCQVVASQTQFGQVENCKQIPKYLKITYQCFSTENMNTVVVCNPDVHTISCPAGGVISIGSAFYGRTNRQTCSFKALIANVECNASTATSAVIAACHHKQSCSVQSTPEWIQSDPCPSTTKYLQIWYTCVAAAYGSKYSQVNTNDKSTTKERNPVGTSRKLLSLPEDKQIINSTGTLKIPLPHIYKLPDYIGRRFSMHATFDEFSSYLLDPQNADPTHDVINHGSSGMRATSVRHWQSYSTLCYPCHVKYDVIAHMETIEEDARYLLKRIGAPPNVHYPGGYDKSGSSSTTFNDVNRLFANLTSKNINGLRQYYNIDYDVFGYKIP